VEYDSIQGWSIVFPQSMDFFNFDYPVVGFFNDTFKNSSHIEYLTVGKKQTEFRYFSTFQNYFLSQDEVVKQQPVQHKNKKIHLL
jgi:hypothetical protein